MTDLPLSDAEIAVYHDLLHKVQLEWAVEGYEGTHLVVNLNKYTRLLASHDALSAERDALSARVRELEAALKQVVDGARGEAETLWRTAEEVRTLDDLMATVCYASAARLRILEASGTFKCPICGLDKPHRHEPAIDAASAHREPRE